MQTEKGLAEDLRHIVGQDNLREATEQDAVDGVEPDFVVEPGSIEEISDLMKLAAREGLAVAPRGGGTKMHIGDPPRRLDLIVSTARMNEVLEHTPGDQIIRLEAGVKLEDLQEHISGSDQMLAIDPPESGATIGGIVAANSSGPRRYRYGTIRDLIIGITVVLHDGTVAKAGGKVVKNVAGYDLSKLFTGSLGTLGVIANANFRLHPRPGSSRTVAVEVTEPQQAQAAAQAIVHSQVEATAVELQYDENEKQLAVLLESIPGGIDAKAETTSFLLKQFGEVRTLSDEEVNHLGPLAPPEVADGVVLKIGAPPAELAAVLVAVLGAAERKGLAHPRITGHAGTGVTLVGFSGENEDGAAGFVEEMREIWVRRGGNVTLQRAPLTLKQRVSTWDNGGDYLGLVRRVKEKFDPRGGMNPGRFLGGN
ncbi:MAG TPA: FAD-binding oxidoreductase [Rubrobacter sp.]|jgi:glycolate oxidase FAD binding subunit|nr:FAD-binding oxidoreductase [Rubrobacter sp.]